MVVFKQRIADSGVGGFLPFTGGQAGVECTLYRVMQSDFLYHEVGSGSGTTTYKGGATYTANSSLSWTNQYIDQKATVTDACLIKDHGQFWIRCTADYSFPCEQGGSNDWLVSDNESGPHGSYHWDHHIAQHMEADSNGYCHWVTSEDKITTTGTSIGNADGSIPAPGTLQVPSDYEPCSRSELVLVELQDDRSATEHYSRSNENGSSTHTGSRSIRQTLTHTLSDQVSKDHLVGFTRARLFDDPSDSDNPVQDVSYGRADFFVYWPVYPEDSNSHSDPCAMTGCVPATTKATGFIYQFRLNKCCGYKTIRCEWDEVFFPKAYLDWLKQIGELSNREDWPPNPGGIVITPKVWTWQGNPPLCNHDSSSSDQTDDPFDDRGMWSPWSAMVTVPEGQEGVVVLRKFSQKCYGELIDDMPGVLGDIIPSDSETIATPDPQ